MLYGRKQPLSQIRRWVEGQRQHKTLCVIGPTGCGKTTAVETIIAEAGLDILRLDDVEKLRQTMSLARSPTFTGQSRVMIIDGMKQLTKSSWASISKMLGGFPLVMISDNLNSIESDISSRSQIVNLEKPSKHHLLDLLSAECERRNLAHSQAILGTIARSAHSYRSALNALNTTPPTADIDELESRRPAVSGSAQSEAILRGQWDGDFSVHPLSILNMAEWNSCDPEAVKTAHLLHSRSWAADGLSHVARAYMRSLRSKTYDRPPFRDRRILGSVRR